MPDFDPNPLVGHIVPDYELLRRIGAGAYGEVWLARSKATGALRAAKIVWRHKFDDDRPFQREFEGIQRFERISREHPSQLALFHIGSNHAEGYFYYVMELADNIGTVADYVPRTLRADLANGRISSDRVLDIALALTEALGHLHQNGLVHRDVKPSNIIFVNGRPKLADIGLVTDLSDSRSIVGTEGYLPPEGPGTPQADIFALGKVLYEITTGLDRRRFPDLPAELKTLADGGAVLEINEVILKACGSNASGRYQTCEEMLSDLELLERGKSLQHKRTREQWLSAFKKAGLASTVLAVAVIAVMFGARQLAPPDYSGDGPPSTNKEATILCEKGLLIVRGDNYRQLADAYTNFHKAIDLDPLYAQPYIGLLELRLREDIPGLPRASQEEMRLLASQLRKLAPHSAARHCAESVVNWFDWKNQQAEKCMTQAISANPQYELGHTLYGFMLCTWGRPIESRDQLEIASSIAPAKITSYITIGQTYYVQRDYTNAIAWEKKALELEPHHSVAFATIGTAYQAIGDYSNALDNFESELDCEGGEDSLDKRKFGELRQAVAARGARGYWEERWRQVEETPSWGMWGDRSEYWKAVIQIHLGNTNAALDWLAQSYEHREHRTESFEPPLSFVLLDESWDGLHDDPRFKAILDKIGFTKVMRSESR
jgi:serine/threonine protein kinase